MDPAIPSPAIIRPWIDAILDERGHDPRSAYVEHFWLSVIGPTATWIMRRFAERFDAEPTGFSLDLNHTAISMGLSFEKGSHSPFGKALHRCAMFGLCYPTPDGLAVRRKVPTVPQRHLKRLPADLQSAHSEWARRIGLSDCRQLEQQLLAAGVPAQIAARASEAAALGS